MTKRAKPAWVMEADGWEVLRRRDGSVDYRKLVSDTGKPNYNGASKRYILLFEIMLGKDAGRVQAINSSGYIRTHDTVSEAKEASR